MPPTSVEVAPCPAQMRVTDQDAARLLADIRGKLPRTAVLSARPSLVCGLVELQLENGNVAFTDKLARYFIMGLMLDTATGRFVSHSAPSTDSLELSQ